MNLAYFAADTTGVTLYQIKDKLFGVDLQEFHLGPWNLDFQVDIESDLIGFNEVGFWLTINKTLKFYLVVQDKQTWLFLLDAKALNPGPVENVKARAKELKPWVKVVFRWKEKGGWTRESFAAKVEGAIGG